VATDRSFVRRAFRGLDVLRAFHPTTDSRHQELAPVQFAEANHFRLTYTLTKLGYLQPVPRFRKVSAFFSRHQPWRWGMPPCQSRRSAFVEPYREELMRETGGAVAVGGRDRHS